MEDTDEFKWALKVVIKRQMRDLMEQLRERGEEIAILTVNLEDNSCSHFGSPNGEWFVSEQKNLIQNFLNFCQTKGKNKRTGYTPSYSYYSPAPAAASKKPAGFKQKATPTTPEKSTATSDMPLVKVTVPRHLAGDISEEELAGLVGRIVATQLVMQEKGDGSTGGTKFDLLLDAANQWKSKDELSSVMSTPSTRSTRKRKVTAKFREGINSLKKGKKSEEEEDVSEQETSHEDSMIFKILAELNSATLKRVRVKLSDETTVDVEHSTLTSSEKFESLAVQVIQELDEVASGLLTNKKVIKIMVQLDENNCDEKVVIGMEDIGLKEVKMEAMDDSDMEYLDLENDGQDEQVVGEDDSSTMQSAADVTSSLVSVTKPSKVAKVKSGPTKVKGKDLLKEPLKPRVKQPKSLIETQPTPCEHCGMTLAGKSNMMSHIRRVHLKMKNKKCTICGKGFWSATARESHMLSVHTRRCEACQEYVVESVPWSAGMDMKQKRDVICTCGAIVSIFSIFGRKRRFMNEEEMEEEGLLQDQERLKSTPGTKYACGTCGKLFMKKSNCERHSRAHTQVKSVECNLCGSQFTYENSLKKHMETEHGIAENVCEVCGKNFLSDTALRVHYVKFHAEENFTIGNNVVMIVKEKGNDTADLEQQMEQIIEGETEHTVVQEVHNGQMPTSTHIVTSQGNQVVVTQGEGGQVTLTTAEGHTVGEKEAAQIVQQVLQQGQVIAQEGNMSIIIKELPLEEME